MRPPGQSETPIAIPPGVFPCPACGVKLTRSPSATTASGPCPACGAWIKDTAARHRADTPYASRKKFHIPADSHLDHQRLENRETMRSLKIVALLLAAFFGCLAAIWFLSHWMNRLGSSNPL
jgi:predicted RNA-binding Zn-ribbon protein involved in translation (DUF1610 family)